MLYSEEFKLGYAMEFQLFICFLSAVRRSSRGWWVLEVFSGFYVIQLWGAGLDVLCFLRLCGHFACFSWGILKVKLSPLLI